MFDYSHIQIFITCAIAGFSSVFALYKLIDKRFTSNEILSEARNVRTTDAILILSKAVSEASGKTMTVDNCVKNNRLQDDKLNHAITDVKIEFHTEIAAVETRLDKRISTIEQKVFGK